MIRVIVVDDHQMVREGLELLVGRFEGIDCVATAANGDEALALAADLSPDVVLMDLSMPGMGGVEATRVLAAGADGPAVLVLTTFADRRHVIDAVDAGAVGYLLKDSGPEQLEAGIRAAARGESPLDPKVAGALVQARREHRPDVALTAREREVLLLVGDGLANKNIARRLGISEKTVKTHLTSVFSALGVGDRVQAALWVERHRSELEERSG